MDSGAGCQAALQPTMSVRFWAAARMYLACQLIISFITGQKTSRRLQPPLCEGEELLIYDIHLRSKSSWTGWSPQRLNVGCWNFSRSTTNIISSSLATSSLPLAVWNTIWVGPSPQSLRLNKKPLECAKVHSYCWLSLKFSWPGRGVAQLQSDQIKISLVWFMVGMGWAQRWSSSETFRWPAAIC